MSTLRESVDGASLAPSTEALPTESRFAGAVKRRAAYLEGVAAFIDEVTG